jgi:ABC-2 type transport system ATP-binding protein
LGLDPQNRAKIWDYISNLKEQTGLTVLLTTHYMDEAEKLADRVGIIDHGRIIIEGTPGELIEQMGADTVRISGQGAIVPFLEKVKGLSFVQEVKIAEEIIHVAVDSGNRRLAELVSLATRNNFTIEDISVAKPSLGEVFLKYTGRQLRDI